MKMYFLLMTAMLVPSFLFSQTVSGTLVKHAGSDLRLTGFQYLQKVQLATARADSNGYFTMNYPADYQGMAFLQTEGENKLTLVLNEAIVQMEGTLLGEPDSLRFVSSEENRVFMEYAVQHRQRENVLTGWKYLKPQYEELDLLKSNLHVRAAITKEIQRIEKEDADYLSGLPADSYMSWYLPKRKLLDDIPASAMRYPERIPAHIADFRAMDFTDPRWERSGILDQVIEGHYWLLENSGRSLDSMFIEMNLSTDHILINLEGYDGLLNQVTQFLFRLMERRSLFKSSEYLAIRLLTQDACVLEDNFARQLESYRAMKKDTLAPDILFDGYKTIQGIKLKGDVRLSELGYGTTLLFFGSSQCPRCQQDLAEMQKLYSKWSQKGLNVVFISLDENENQFVEFIREFPWLSYCDFIGWESPPVKDYYVFGTPTMFLLDKDRRILVRPGSVKQVDAWVEYKM